MTAFLETITPYYPIIPLELTRRLQRYHMASMGFATKGCDAVSASERCLIPFILFLGLRAANPPEARNTPLMDEDLNLSMRYAFIELAKLNDALSSLRAGLLAVVVNIYSMDVNEAMRSFDATSRLRSRYGQSQDMACSQAHRLIDWSFSQVEW